MAEPSPALIGDQSASSTASPTAPARSSRGCRAAGAGGRLRGVRALPVQRADHLVVRRDLHAVRHPLHARRRLRAAQGRAHPHRLLLGALSVAHARADRLHLLRRLLLSASSCSCLVSWHEGSVRLPDRRDFGPDAVAAGPVAVQDGRAARLPAAADPGHLGADQELLHGAHRHRARAQREGREYDRRRLHRPRHAGRDARRDLHRRADLASRCCSSPSPSATSAWAHVCSTSPTSRPSA